MLACTALVGCTSEDVVENNETIEKGKAYVAVNIKTFDHSSRAAEGTYEDGVEAENAVTKARFYFFDNGNAVTVSNAGNYVDVTDFTWSNYAGSSTSDPAENETTDNNGNKKPGEIEEKSNVVVVLDPVNGALPTQVAVVLNPPTSLTGSKNLSDLETLNADYCTDLISSGSFVLSNSVYKDEVMGTKALAVALEDKNISSDRSIAQQNPITVFVERVVAKVRVSSSDEDLTFDTGETTKINDKEEAVNVKILGWEINKKINKSYLFKSIDLSWTNTALGFTWNDAPYYRSYWANTPSEGTAFNETNTWNGIGKSLLASEVNYDYCQENTSGTETEVVVKAQLQDTGGDPLEIAEWYNEQYTVQGLKNKIATTLANTFYTRTKTTNADGSESYAYVSIEPGDIDFTTTTDNSVEDYEVIVTLSEAGKTKEFFAKGSTAEAGYSVEYVNGELAKIQPARIWKNGQTYYYLPIKHLGSEGKLGEYGIVRNHIYDIKISAVSGLGTPVYKGDKAIITTTPDDVKAYIAAQVYILSWRVVANDDVTLK